jgi:hypothetical protein
MLTAITLTLALDMKDRGPIGEYLGKLINDDPAPRDTWPLSTTMRSLLDSPEAARTELHRFSTDPAYGLPVVRNAIAIWASFFGDHELALAILRGLNESGQFTIFAIWRPIHKEMRRLPGFKDLVREAGLVDYWRSTGNWGDYCHPLGHGAQYDFECQ